MQSEEGHQWQKNDIPPCDIRTPSRVAIARSTISPPSHHLNPSTDDERDVGGIIAGRELAGDCSKDELAVNKLFILRISYSMVVFS